MRPGNPVRTKTSVALRSQTRLPGALRIAAATSAAAALSVGLAPGLAVAAPPAQAFTAAHLSCAGDTLSGSVTVLATTSATMTVRLQTRSTESPGGSGFTSTRVTAGVDVTPGKKGYTWSFNTVGLPATVKAYRAVLTLGALTDTTNVVPAARCAPGQEVPEVPAALLVPLTLSTTGVAVLELRRRAAVA